MLTIFVAILVIVMIMIKNISKTQHVFAISELLTGCAVCSVLCMCMCVLLIDRRRRTVRNCLTESVSIWSSRRGTTSACHFLITLISELVQLYYSR